LVQNPPILESSGEQEELQETFESVPTSEITIQPEHINDSSNGMKYLLNSCSYYL
jgi:hypothetical protein